MSQLRAVYREADVVAVIAGRLAITGRQPSCSTGTGRCGRSGSGGCGTQGG
jgi:hypothetical protein